MGYTRVGDIGDVFSKVASGVQVATGVLTNTYFNEITCRFRQLEANSSGQPVPFCASTPQMPDNLGIGKFMPVLRGYVYAEQHPWAYPLIIGLILGVPFALGYAVGKK
jgi:hypothetical protein